MHLSETGVKPEGKSWPQAGSCLLAAGQVFTARSGCSVLLLRCLSAQGQLLELLLVLRRQQGRYLRCPYQRCARIQYFLWNIHRITESQNHIGWKRPLRSSSPTINLTLPKPPLHHVSKHLIQTSFKYLQGWRLNHFPGQPVPMLDNPLGEEKFPNIQSKPPLAQLEAISSCPITCYLGEETDPHLSTTSFQAKQSQLPQPLLIRLLLQTLHQLRCPSLDTLRYLNIPLVVGGPKLNTAFEVRPHQCRVQGHNHFPSPAGHAIFDTSQDAIGFLGRLGTLLAHIQAAVNKHPQVLLCQAAFQPLFPKPVALHGVAVAQVQDLALGLVKPHTIDLGPSIQPVQVPLQSLPTLQQINTPTQLGVVCKLTESALDPFVQIINKDVKQNWPQHRALGNTACDRPPTRVNSIHHHSLGPAVQPVLYPAKSTPVQAMSSQFLQENAVGDRCILEESKGVPPGKQQHLYRYRKTQRFYTNQNEGRLPSLIRTEQRVETNRTMLLPPLHHCVAYSPTAGEELKESPIDGSLQRYFNILRTLKVISKSHVGCDAIL
ncbi:hypothetical protein QYF61_017576 [Mycteria americana]|uniref:Uncharacterized protein n=1 Tax=Mycteria americana TaxID=33587 RepID=A0AAN7RSV6_MYCAM|nr:hypothetical protein QYF61_017576 [Mycteria americana]